MGYTAEWEIRPYPRDALKDWNTRPEAPHDLFHFELHDDGTVYHEGKWPFRDAEVSWLTTTYPDVHFDVYCDGDWVEGALNDVDVEEYLKLSMFHDRMVEHPMCVVDGVVRWVQTDSREGLDLNHDIRSLHQLVLNDDELYDAIWAMYMQRIGYSVSGGGGLNCTRNGTVAICDELAEKYAAKTLAQGALKE